MSMRCGKIDKVSTHSTHQFAEKVALITDVIDPVGRAVALQLALNGAFVVVGVPPGSDPNDAVSDLRSLGTLAFAVEADLTSEKGRQALIGEVSRNFGRLDLLVNCLKFASESTFVKLIEPIADVGIAGKISANLLTTRAAFDLMAERPRARIVNVCTLEATDLGSENIENAVVTGAIEGFTSHLAASLPSNFRANCVTVRTTAVEPVPLDELFRPKNTTEPDDIARVVLFLLSSESGSVNGQIVRLG